jgi:hypothetical protein
MRREILSISGMLDQVEAAQVESRESYDRLRAAYSEVKAERDRLSSIVEASKGAGGDLIDAYRGAAEQTDRARGKSDLVRLDNARATEEARRRALWVALAERDTLRAARDTFDRAGQINAEALVRALAERDEARADLCRAWGERDLARAEVERLHEQRARTNLAAARGADTANVPDADLGTAGRGFGYRARTAEGDAFETAFEWARENVRLRGGA